MRRVPSDKAQSRPRSTLLRAPLSPLTPPHPPYPIKDLDRIASQTVLMGVATVLQSVQSHPCVGVRATSGRLRSCEVVIPTGLPIRPPSSRPPTVRQQNVAVVSPEGEFFDPLRFDTAIDPNKTSPVRRKTSSSERRTSSAGRRFSFSFRRTSSVASGDKDSPTNPQSRGRVSPEVVGAW